MTDTRYVLGIDLGSTTVKYVLWDLNEEKILERAYVRHESDVLGCLTRCLTDLQKRRPLDRLYVRLTGSGALGLAKSLNLPFVQEVVAAADSLRHYLPGVDAAVELGGEDAKILYLSDSVELRMNEACAGGTGAFIDQAAALLKTDAAGLNTLALEATQTYPVASRCGVFAKTDIVGLLNTGVSRADIAKSIFAAVAEQAVSGLSCGRPLQGKIAFLGGPLTFLSALREAFVERIGTDGVTYEPVPQAQYAVALGAALDVKKTLEAGQKPLGAITMALLMAGLKNPLILDNDAKRLPPLFEREADIDAFLTRHAGAGVKRLNPALARGPLYLGIDLGSTTVKTVLMTPDGKICHHHYAHNQGAPLTKLFDALRQTVALVPEGAYIRSICTTGYGAHLARSAVNAAFSDVETLAHQRAASRFDPLTSYVIDIGGQDMKCLKVKNGHIVAVTLNEACSSGCGAFLETFAAQLGLTIEEFVEAALHAKAPCDLGSRCTVFMTSKVRQAQRDGADTADIAAGLCISIVRNALHKVLKVKDMDELGEHIVVQGGTFLNNAVLRAFEQHTGRHVTRPDLAGLMGAYGAALIAAERTTDATPVWDASVADLDPTSAEQRTFRCRGCQNRCELTQHRFPSGQRLITGNRCDFALRDLRRNLKRRKSFVDWKQETLFGGEPLAAEDAPRGEIGLPRVLNLYEHYPYWAAFFKALGFRTVLSPATRASMVKKATPTVPSQSLCLPAKLAHAHLLWLADKGVKNLWFPCIPREEKLFAETHDSYACPVVGGYPEAIPLNLKHDAPQARILTPFLRIDMPDTVVRAVKEAFPDIPESEIRSAAEKGRDALTAYRRQLKARAAAVWNAGERLIVLASHPYHLDPFVNHGIPNLIESMGCNVITEDAVALLAEDGPDVDVINQWAFHSRLYRAARMCIKRENTELIQLVSFGCGIDAITSEQVRRQLESAGKLYTLLKIDETDSLGAARIRIASLFAAMNDKAALPAGAVQCSPVQSRPTPQAEPADTEPLTGRTLYIPQMAPIHFPLLTAALAACGYRVKLLPTVSDRAIELGLRYVNNDACYPAVVVIGQLLEAIEQPDFDPATSAFLLAQTCGPCRATNYPTLLKWALRDIGCEAIPIVSLSSSNLSGINRLKLSVTDLQRLVVAMLLGDLLQRLTLQRRAHERIKGQTQGLLFHWTLALQEEFHHGLHRLPAYLIEDIVRDFARIECDHDAKPVIGIVGEILLKYHPKANQDMTERILKENAEPRQGDLTNFILYCLHDHWWQTRHFNGPKLSGFVDYLLMKYIDRQHRRMGRVLEKYGFEGIPSIEHLSSLIDGFVSTGQQAGEGWLLTAEILHFLENGVNNVLCLQPFACLPNHITGRGVMRGIREHYPQANVTGIDFEAGTAESNVANRLKLFMSQTDPRKPRRIANRADRVIPIIPNRPAPAASLNCPAGGDD